MSRLWNNHDEHEPVLSGEVNEKGMATNVPDVETDDYEPNNRNQGKDAEIPASIRFRTATIRIRPELQPDLCIGVSAPYSSSRRRQPEDSRGKT